MMFLYKSGMLVKNIWLNSAKFSGVILLDEIKQMMGNILFYACGSLQRLILTLLMPCTIIEMCVIESKLFSNVKLIISQLCSNYGHTNMQDDHATTIAITIIILTFSAAELCFVYKKCECILDCINSKIKYVVL